MRYVLIDDEKRAVNLLRILLERSDYFRIDDEITTFTDSIDAYQYVIENGADIIFLDIEMPYLNGLSFAQKLVEHDLSNVDVVFVTAYSQYSLKAWDIGVAGYLLKPFDIGQLDKILGRILKRRGLIALDQQISTPANQKPHMRCFPDFEMLVNNTPVLFKSKKSKELLAFLVHNQGNWVSIEKIVFNLMENLDESSSKNYTRTLTYRLRQALEQVGFEQILESEYGKLRVNPSLFTCDYYEYLEGKTSRFQGEYLEEYDWAEPAKASMWHTYHKT